MVNYLPTAVGNDYCRCSLRDAVPDRCVNSNSNHIEIDVGLQRVPSNVGKAKQIDLELPTLLPGIRVNTNQTNYHPIRQLQLGKFDGARWVGLGEVITGSGN